MTKLYYDRDADLAVIQDKKIAVLGYGSQGHAQAQNLRDSGLDVTVGLYEGSKSREKVTMDGLPVATVTEASKQADIIQILIGDNTQPAVFREEVLPNLAPGKAIVVSHGFNVLYNQIVPPEFVDVYMVAPKSPGHILRRMYQKGTGVPGLIAVHQDYTGQAKAAALAYARGIGCTRAGVIETTFQEETETDLFGEQAVLCGGVTALIKAGFDTLVEAGYQPEVAYFECLNELKLIVDLIFEGGFEYMRYSVSDTAEFGDLTRGPRVINEQVREEMRKMLREVQDGRFALEWISENQAGRPRFNALRRMEEEHPITAVGRELRKMMTWVKEEE